MANETIFSIDNLNSDPSYNFSNSLFNSDLLNTHDDDLNDSPYSNLDVQCTYFDENQYVTNFKNLKKFSILFSIYKVFPLSLQNFKN